MGVALSKFWGWWRHSVREGSYPESSSSSSSFLSCYELEEFNPEATETHQSSSSSSSSTSTNYDVFLSFCGKDTRASFTSHLYHELDRAGIQTFMDEEELKKGEEIAPNLLKAIAESRISIPIFSTNYASSKWCLNELVKMMESRDTNGQIVLPIFFNVDPRHVRNQIEDFGKPFNHLAEKFDKGTVERWKKALREAGGLKGWDLKNPDNRYLLQSSAMANTYAHVPARATACKNEKLAENEAAPQHLDDLQEFEDESNLLTGFAMEPAPVFENDFFLGKDAYYVDGIQKPMKAVLEIPICHPISSYKGEVRYPSFKLPSVLVRSAGLSHRHTITATSRIVHSDGEHDTYYLGPITLKLYVSHWPKTPTLGKEIIVGTKAWLDRLRLRSVLPEINDVRDKTRHRQWAEEICKNFSVHLGEAGIAGAVALSSCHFPLKYNALQALVENWCPEINFFRMRFGEMSITPADMVAICGLPYGGDFFEEWIPSRHQLAMCRKDSKGELQSIFPSCTVHLFEEYKKLCEADKAKKRQRGTCPSGKVSTFMWLRHFCILSPITKRRIPAS